MFEIRPVIYSIIEDCLHVGLFIAYNPKTLFCSIELYWCYVSSKSLIPY